jgi:ABC-type ATPase with predicted acetyltransferase domain
VVPQRNEFSCSRTKTTYNLRVRIQHTSKPVSRQRLWQKQQVALGRCAICGNKRPSDLKILCRRCQDKANELHMRLYYASKERR